MGSILSAIRDDMDEYQDLCRKYGEEVQTTLTAQGVRLPDSYGKHAAKLKKRQAAEWAAAHAARSAAKVQAKQEPAPASCPWDNWRPSKDL